MDGNGEAKQFLNLMVSWYPISPPKIFFEVMIWEPSSNWNLQIPGLYPKQLLLFVAVLLDSKPWHDG